MVIIKTIFNISGPICRFSNQQLLRRTLLQAIQNSAPLINYKSIIAILSCFVFIYKTTGQEFIKQPAIIPYYLNIQAWKI